MKMVFFPMQNLTLSPQHYTTFALDVKRFALRFSFLSFIFQVLLDGARHDVQCRCREQRRTERH